MAWNGMGNSNRLYIVSDSILNSSEPANGIYKMGTWSLKTGRLNQPRGKSPWIGFCNDNDTGCNDAKSCKLN